MLSRREIVKLHEGIKIKLYNGSIVTITSIYRNKPSFQKWNNIISIWSGNTEIKLKHIKYIVE